MRSDFKNVKMMETITRERAIKFNNRMIRERIFVDIPQSEMVFFKLFADKMGWSVNSKQNLWDEYMKSSPTNIDLSEEEILEEVRAVRYGKVQANR